MTNPSRGLIALLYVGAFGISIVLFLFMHPLARLPAAYNGGNLWWPVRDNSELAVWVYNPHVRPGDTVTLEVGVYGKKIAIRDIKFSDGTNSGRVRGSDAEVPQTKGGGTSNAMQEFDWEVPSDAAPGSVLPLRLEVRYTVAGVEKTAVGEVPLQVYATAGAWLRRGLSAAQALGLFGLVFLIVRWVAPKMAGWDSPEALGIEDKKFFGWAVCMWFAAFGYLGYLLFALPLLAATTITSSWFCGILVGVWLVGPLWLAHRFPAPSRPEENEPPDQLGADRVGWTGPTWTVLPESPLWEHFGATRADGTGVVRLPMGWKAVERPTRAYELSALEDDPSAAVVTLGARAALADSPAFDVKEEPGDVLELTATQGCPGFVAGSTPGTAVWTDGRGRLTLRFADPAAIRPDRIELVSDDAALVEACCRALRPIFGELLVQQRGTGAYS